MAAINGLQEKKLKGFITPSDWNEHGDVIELTLATDGEKDYRIISGEDFKDLVKLSGTQVVVTGLTGKDVAGKLTVTIQSADSADSWHAIK